MAQRICSVDGCERKHLARGVCKKHYDQQHRDRQAEYYDRVCITCDEPFRSARSTGKFCSEICYHFDRWGARTCQWPRPTRAPVALRPKPEPFREQRECGWCGANFTASRKAQVFCSRACNKKAGRNRRRGREFGSTSHFTWAEVMRLFVHVFDRRCAYCSALVAGSPDPDHVVPLSKGGSNSITNIVPACRPCNSDKRDLLLHEWVSDRERRGLPRLPFDLRDSRFVHLTDAHLISPAA